MTVHTETSVERPVQAQWIRVGAARRLRQRRPGRVVRPGCGAAAGQADLRGLPVIAECLADALDNRTEFGVWGGMTERERRSLLKRRPEVTSWRPVLDAVRARGTRVA